MLRVCPECGQEDGEAALLRPVWAQWHGAPLWCVLACLGVIAWTAANTAVWKTSSQYFYSAAMPTGITANEVRAAGAGDRESAEKVVGAFDRLLEENPQLIGQARLGLATEGATPGVVRRRVAFGAIPWIVSTANWRYIGLGDRSPGWESSARDPEWRWDGRSLTLLWSHASAKFPQRFFAVRGNDLAVVLVMAVAGCTLVMRLLRPRPGLAKSCVAVGGLLLVAWPRIKIEERYAGSQGHVALGVFRAMSPLDRDGALVVEALRLVDGAADDAKLVISARTEFFAKCPSTVVGWPAGWVGVSDLPLSDGGTGGEETGVSWVEGGVIQVRTIHQGALLRNVDISIAGIARTLAPVVLLACVPRWAWDLTAGLVRRRRRRTKCCVGCGYQLG